MMALLTLLIAVSDVHMQPEGLVTLQADPCCNRIKRKYSVNNLTCNA